MIYLDKSDLSFVHDLNRFFWDVLGRSLVLGAVMHSGQLVFAQVMTYLPLKAFSRMVQARRAQHKVKDFSCLDQFLALSFAQLTARESLRDIEINLRVQRQHLYHLGFRCKTISSNILTTANRVRRWKSWPTWRII